MSKNRIFYIHGGGDTIGGIETYLANSLKFHTIYEPYVGIVKDGRFSEYLKKSGFKNIINLEGGRLRELPKTIKAIHKAINFIKENSINLLIAHGIYSWVYAGIIKYIYPIKTIFYVHAKIEKKDFRELISGIGLRLKPTLYIANSQFTAKSILKFLKTNAEVNYPGTDINEFNAINEIEAKKKLQKEFNIPNNKFIFSIIGRIQNGKGQDIAILAFKKIKNKHNSILLIIGDPTFKEDKEYYEYLKELAQAEENIIFTGFRKDIPVLMKASDVIIHASKIAETFGIAIVEGMMSKRPVIASAQGGPLEIIDNGKNGFLYKPENYEELSKIMDKLFEDKFLYSQIASEAYKKAKEYFTMEVSIGNLEKIISKILNH